MYPINPPNNAPANITVISLSIGLNTRQFYLIDISETDPTKILGGAQDNGTEMLTNSVWDAIRGADGMECAIDDYDEDSESNQRLELTCLFLNR